MEIWKAVILGIVQGLTEFLPVSSSGHLVFFQKLLNVDLEAGQMFLGVMLHLGTLVAVIIVFFKDILGLFKPPFHKMFLLIVATIPAGLVGLFLGDEIDAIFYGGEYLCYFFLLSAILLYISEIIAKKYPEGKELSLKSSLVMGGMQALAVVPGLSRSGSTIAGGSFCKVKRDSLARFSFLMSAPVICGAAIVEIYKQFVKGDGLPSGDMLAVIIGMITACICGYLAIRFMLKIISKANYKWFSLYLVLLAIFTFINNFVLLF